MKVALIDSRVFMTDNMDYRFIPLGKLSENEGCSSFNYMNNLIMNADK